MLIRKAGIGVTLAATLVLVGTSLFAADSVLDRFSFEIAGAKDPGLYRAYTQFPDKGTSVVPNRLNLVITRYASDAERDVLFSIASGAGTSKVPDALNDMAAAGYVNWPGGSSYTIRYARRVPRPDGGQDLVLITDGRAWPWWQSGRAWSDDARFSVIQVRLNGQGSGEGKMSFGATVAANKEAGLMLSDYAREQVVLGNVRQEDTPRP